MKKTLCIALLLLAIIAGAGWFYILSTQYAAKPLPAENSAMTQQSVVAKKVSLKQKVKNVLNLALPENRFLMDRDVVIPENKHDLHELFREEAKESTVKVGGRLILDEKPPQPDAPIWNQVKGAEVGVTVKTP